MKIKELLESESGARGTSRWVFAVIITSLLLFSLLMIPKGAVAQRESDNSCYTCHIQLGGKMKDSAVGWKQGIHSKVGVTCDSCHGGNPFISTLASMNEEYGYRGAFSAMESVELCASCHSDVSSMKQYNLRTDQYEEYKTSQHGKLIAAGDTKAATCASCHGVHEIRKKNDPRSSVFHTNVPETCARCHADEKLMEEYGTRTDQYEVYRKGYHGKILYGKIAGKNPMIVPNCATCHGIHGASPPGISEVANVCGNCHTNIYRFFNMGPHARAVIETGKPRCVDCHGNHSNVYPSLDLFVGTDQGKCGFCHEEDGEEYKRGQEMREKLEELKKQVDTIVDRASKARELGRNIERLNNAASALRATYIQMIPITHTVDNSILTPLFSDARDQIKIANEEFDRIQAENRMRKRVSTTAVTLLLTIAALLMVKLWRLNRESS